MNGISEHKWNLRITVYFLYLSSLAAALGYALALFIRNPEYLSLLVQNTVGWAILAAWGLLFALMCALPFAKVPSDFEEPDAVSVIRAAGSLCCAMMSVGFLMFGPVVAAISGGPDIPPAIPAALTVICLATAVLSAGMLTFILRRRRAALWKNG